MNLSASTISTPNSLPFKAKLGPAGKRNRRAKRRAEERRCGPRGVHVIHAHREINNAGGGTSNHFGPLFQEAAFSGPAPLKDVADVACALEAEQIKRSRGLGGQGTGGRGRAGTSGMLEIQALVSGRRCGKTQLTAQVVEAAVKNGEIHIATAQPGEGRFTYKADPSPDLMGPFVLDFPSERWAEQWDEDRAAHVLHHFKQSGMSARGFANVHGFPESRIRAWSKRLGVVG
jgi:hypothetical protein